MANLKSYSCPKCGGILNVDTDKDTFDCPFCGNRFSYVEFHRKDLQDLAEDLLKRGEFAAAKEKYMFLFKEGCTDFRTLQGYLFSVANIRDSGKLNDINIVSRCNTAGITKLIEEDKRYSQGQYKDYFEALSELVKTSKSYEETKKELQRITVYSKKWTPARSIATEEAESRKLYITVAITAVLGTVISFNLMDKINLWGFAIVLGAVIAEFVIHYTRLARGTNDEKQKESSGKAGKNRVSEKERLESELRNAEETFNEISQRLKDLTPKNEAATKPAITPEVKEKAKESGDEPICTKCGGILTHDKESKLFVCNHCGITYGYALIFGEPRRKAAEEMMRGEFGTARKRYEKILSADPHDFDALRGMILCSGRWPNFAKISLTKNLKTVDFSRVLELAEKARTDCYPEYKEYFDEVRYLVFVLRAFSQNLIKREIEPGNPLYQQESELIKLRFNDQLRKVMDWDKRLTSLSPEEREELRSGDKAVMAAEAMERRDFSTATQAYALVITDEPQNFPAWRGLILSMLQTVSVLELRKMATACTADVKQIEAVVNQALATFPDEYTFYFNSILRFLSCLEQYQDSNRQYNLLRREEEKAMKAIDEKDRSLPYGFERKKGFAEQERKRYKVLLEKAVEDLVKLDQTFLKKEKAAEQ